MSQRGFQPVPLGALLYQRTDYEQITHPHAEQFVTVRLHGNGAVPRTIGDGKTPRMAVGLRIHKGDLIYSRIDARNGAFALVPPALHGAVVSKDFPAFEIDEDRVHPAYLIRWLTYPPFYQSLSEGSAGTTNRQRIAEHHLLTRTIPLPSRSVQALIVEMLGEADGLRRLRAEADRRTADLLRSAFDHSFGPAMSAASATIADVAAVGGGIQLSASRHSLPLARPYLRVANVQRGRLVLDEIKEIRCTEEEAARTELQRGDLLLVEGNGSADEIGRAAVWDGSVQGCVHQNHLIRVRVRSDLMLPEWLCWALQHPTVRAYFQRAGKTTSGLFTISIGVVKRCPICVPPLNAQRDFVARVADIASIQAAQAESGQRLEDLYRAMLHRAFQGELIAWESVQVAVPSPAVPVRRHGPVDRLTRRAAVASSLSRRFRTGAAHRKYVGVTLIEKALFLLEAHAGLALGGVYRRMPRGPHDPSARQWVEDNAPASGWLVVQQRNSHDRELVEYKPGPSIADADEIATAVIEEQGSAASAVEALLRRIASWNTEDAEMYATLYAAWNDLLFDARQQQRSNPTATAPTPTLIPTDRIIAEFHDWHREKRDKFSVPRLKAALASMRTWGLVPSGQRLVTVTEPSLFAGSATEKG
jgi:type I restriction enzyme S subunit